MVFVGLLIVKILKVYGYKTQIKWVTFICVLYEYLGNTQEIKIFDFLNFIVHRKNFMLIVVNNFTLWSFKVLYQNEIL